VVGAIEVVTEAREYRGRQERQSSEEQRRAWLLDLKRMRQECTSLLQAYRAQEQSGPVYRDAWSRQSCGAAAERP